MFGTLGGPEVILILVVALIVFGPRRLPEIGKSMGKMLAEFRKASNDFKRTIDDELEAEKARESQAQIPAAPSYAPAEITPPETTPVARASVESTPVVISPPEPWRPPYDPPPWSASTAEPAPPATDAVPGASEAVSGASPAPEPEPRADTPVETAASRNRSADE
jgi:Tat protein translocase TatB subunit